MNITEKKQMRWCDECERETEHYAPDTEIAKWRIACGEEDPADCAEHEPI